MDIQNQFYQFYRPYLKKICQAIETGRTLIFVGINSIGKTLLVNQILSKKFKKEFLKKQKVHLVFLEFKDKNPPTADQLYKYWLIQTAQGLGYQLNQKETFNEFSFYSHLTQMAKSLKEEEKIVFILLDFQQIRKLGEALFRSLIYLSRFTYGKVSYIVLSEPHILDCRNIWAQRFIQDFTNYKYIFLKLFDKKTILADIQREEGFLKTKLKKSHRPLIVRCSGGLHGVVGALCYFLKNNPQIKNIRELRKIVFADKLYRYWIKDIFDSLPAKSTKILKELSLDKKRFKKYRQDIYGKWLMDLGFLKKNGTFRHPLMLPILNDYRLSKDEKDIQLKIDKNQFYMMGEKIRLTKKEKLVLEALYKSKGKLVTYDEIGEILWQKEEEKFSLWAISQLIRRLRKKLAFYYINPKAIRSQRGEGYILD